MSNRNSSRLNSNPVGSLAHWGRLLRAVLVLLHDMVLQDNHTVGSLAFVDGYGIQHVFNFGDPTLATEICCEHEYFNDTQNKRALDAYRVLRMNQARQVSPIVKARRHTNFLGIESTGYETQQINHGNSIGYSSDHHSSILHFLSASPSPGDTLEMPRGRVTVVSTPPPSVVEAARRDFENPRQSIFTQAMALQIGSVRRKRGPSTQTDQEQPAAKRARHMVSAASTQFTAPPLPVSNVPDQQNDAASTAAVVEPPMTPCSMIDSILAGHYVEEQSPYYQPVFTSTFVDPAVYASTLSSSGVTIVSVQSTT